MVLLYNELKHYDHIIFDWNGTLLSDVEFTLGVLNQALDAHKHPTLTYEEFRDRFSFPIRDFYKSLGMKDEHYDYFQHHFHTGYNNGYKNTQLFTGTLELIQELRSQGKKLSVLSASEQNHLHEAVEHFGVMEHMHHVYGLSHRTALGKAERGGELLKEVSIERSKTVIVGDTLYDAEVGKFLNIDVLLVGDGHQSLKQLSKAECRILPSRFL